MKTKRLVSGLLCVMLLTNLVAAGAVGQNFEPVGGGLFGAPAGAIRESATQSVSPPETVALSTLNGDARQINFDENWRFNFGDVTGAQNATYNDSSWEGVNLPHDFSITQEFTKTGEAESGYLLGGTGWYRKQFSLPADWAGKTITLDFGGAYMDTTVYLNGEELGQHHYGYTPFSFPLPADKLNYGGNNVIAVKVVNTTPSSRWYSGSGIYRSVNLTVTNAVHVARYGTTVTTPDFDRYLGTVAIKTALQNDGAAATSVSVRNTVYRDGDMSTPVASVVTGAPVSIAAGASAIDNATLNVETPVPWHIRQGVLYVVRTEVLGEDGAVLDTYDTTFGFRYFTFDRETGFSLNGRRIKLQGMCMHHDQGALGAAAYYRSIERQVEILQEMGVNAIRVTHNPASDELIDICNRKGMLVIDEAFDTWEKPKNGNSNDFSKWFNVKVGETTLVGVNSTMTWAEVAVRAMTSRGKNAPSIIMWSLGNEIFEGFNDQPASGRYAEVATNLIGWVKDIDTTRPTTFGQNSNNDTEAWKVAEAINAAGGVIGFNYANTKRFQDIYNDTNWKIYGAETASAVNTRGVYDRKNNNSDGGKGDKRLTSYDKSAVGWGKVASDAWYTAITQDFNAGEFVWTGFDYIGEPTPWNGTGSGAVGTWPSPKSSYFGVIDTNGFPKDSFYFYQSQWNNEVNTLHILPTWNENELMKDADGNVEVVVYSDAAKVKLEYVDAANNVTDLGTKEFTPQMTTAGYKFQIYAGADKSDTAHENLYLTWKVPYAAGTLRATAYDASGNVITRTDGRSSVTTTGAASKLVLSADRQTISADGKDLSYVTIDVQDAQGNLVNGTATQPEITLSISGNGKIIGTDNGVQADHTSYQSLTKKAGAGKLLAIVQADDKTGGDFTVTATADGLTAGTVTVSTTPTASSDKNPVSYVISRYYYVQTGTKPALPEKITINYSDGTTKEVKVAWDAITDEQISKTGSFTATGKPEGEDFTVYTTVNMMSGVAALLNYSTAIVVGGTPTLPSTRPVVMADGSMAGVDLAVAWDMPEASAFDHTGVVSIEGTADAFGQPMHVTATVRVGEATVTEGSNAAAANMEITTEVDADAQSGTLASLTDGSTSGAPWTATATNADVKFKYATAQNLGKAVVSVYTLDSDTAPVTAPNSIKMEWSPDGSTWNEISATAKAPVTAGNITKHTFTFAGVPAVFFRVTLNNDVNATCGLTEIELYTVTTNFSLNTSAALSKVTLNGVAASNSEVTARSISTPALKIKTVTAESAVNASYTYVPPVDNKALLIAESEDGQTRLEYRITLGAEPSVDRDPADDSTDYDYLKTTASAASKQDPGGTATEGPVEFAIDGNNSTYWHSKWTEDLRNTPEKRYIMLTLDEATTLEALRYLPRPEIANGIVTQYRVETSMDNSTWKTVSEGTWAHNTAWKLAAFTEPVEAKYVKLYGVETKGGAGDNPNQFMSAAEVRVVTPDTSKTDISGAVVTLSATEYEHTGAEIKPEPTVSLNGTELEYGYDYVLRYENNTEIGTAKAKIIGILNYSGTTSKEFSIIAPVVYEITYDLAGGAVASANPATYTSQDAAITLNNPTREGYTFAGWTGTDLTGPTMSVTIPTGSTGNRDYTATWTKNDEPQPTVKHTVTFNANGGSAVASVQVESGKTLTKPTDPTRSNYRFAGWFTDEALTMAYDFTKPVTADLTLYASWNKKSSGGDSGSTGGNTGGTTTQPGGTTTTETTKPDGSKETTVVNKDTGETTVTTKATDGSQSTVKTDKDGKVTAEVTLSSKTEDKATLPMPSVKPSASAATAPSVTIKSDKAMTVTIPVTEKSDSVVAILVGADGKETILPKAAMGENGLLVSVSGQTTIKLVDNQKSFGDVNSTNWAKSSVDFVASRELFTGTSATSFSPNEKMTRGMLVTVLWRYESKPAGGTAAFGDVASDAYYAEAVAWASSKNIVTGTGTGYNPNGDITREQFATILYRYAGSPATAGMADKEFTDSAKVSSYASDAMRWAVSEGIISGKNGNLLAPQDSATRAEVAAMMERFAKASA